jgi:hypothetical protein
MQQLFFLTVLSFVLFSCSGNKKQAETTTTIPTYELDDLLAVADQELDNTITVVGYVTHTCKHSGKRCFIVGESQEASIRIEANDDIKEFNPELVGSKLAITGILRENRLSQDYIAEMEEEVNLKKEEDGSAESCAAELSNINDMRKWMLEHDKDYYVIYYIDGLSFEILD